MSNSDIAWGENIQIEALQAQIDALTKTTSAGVFHLSLDEHGVLSDIHHPDNWIAFDPRLLNLPASSAVTLENIVETFGCNIDEFVQEVNDKLVVDLPRMLRSAAIDHHDGGTRWLELKIDFVRDVSPGKFVCLQGSVNDRTQDHALNADLEELGKFLNNILLEVPVAIFRIDLHAQASEVMNFASIYGNWMMNASALYGLPEGTVKSPFDTLNYIHPEDREAVSAKFNEARGKGQSRYEVQYRTTWPDGSLHWLASKSFIHLDNNGELASMSGIQYDITDTKLQQERIEFMAGHDVLTDLPNRVLLMETLERAVAAGRRYKRHFALFYLDLDNFKFVNDTLGHDAGDKLLIEVSQRFRAALRASELISRIGGDEFVILVDGFATKEQLSIIAERLVKAIKTPVFLSGQACEVTVSIGISIFPDDSDDCEALIQKADIALYIAKQKGKNNFQFYEPDAAEKSIGQRRQEESKRHGKILQ